MPGHPFKPASRIKEFSVDASLLFQLDQIRRLLEGFAQCHPEIVGDHFRDLVGLIEADVKNPGDILHHRFGFEGSEGGDLRNAIDPVFFRNVVDHFSSSLEAEIDIEVRHAYPFGVEEALEEQVVFDRIDVGDVK
ncbi:MAG: hypothetical protein BWY50_02042 [Spirochaetes bacterium ADurb.Bin315]|nr:MAG: hypothetical protein BWY50_02042 [Spirochaetes bacterium ADurb.Bin315]